MSEWTDSPKYGAHWFQIAGCLPDIVWVYRGMVLDTFGHRTNLCDDRKSGLFYPVALPPPMPGDVEPDWRARAIAAELKLSRMDDDNRHPADQGK